MNITFTQERLNTILSEMQKANATEVTFSIEKIADVVDTEVDPIITDIGMDFYQDTKFAKVCTHGHGLIIYPIHMGRQWKWCPICKINLITTSSDRALMAFQDESFMYV